MAEVQVGTEWMIDALGCAPSRLCSLPLLRDVCGQIVADLQLKVIGEPHWHQFPAPGGVTGLYLLSESHLACHTYPEYGTATFNLYCCRSRSPWPWHDQLRELLAAQEVTVCCVPRGRPAPSVWSPTSAVEGAQR